ncbi:MAG: transcription-repair coupling factor [Clostridia bacterium]|nr:transcription-repair coupling factor [Clostridia bacterium]
MVNTSLLKGEFRLSREYTGLIKALGRPVQRGRGKPLVALGLSEGATYAFCLTLAEDVLADAEEKHKSGLLLLCAEEKEAAALAAFLSDAGVKAALYPARDYNYNHVTSSHDYEHERLNVLSSLVRGDEPFVITATPEAALQVTLSPEKLASLTVTVAPTDTVDTASLADTLARAGYSRVELVEGAGQFAVRGGIIDVYPPAGAPIRMELFGDEIDRLGFFDPKTQRFTEMTDAPVVIPPALELLPDAEARENIAAAVRRQVPRLRKAGTPEAARIIDLLENERVAAENGLEMDFADKYLPLICPEGASLFSYFDGTVVLFDSANLETRTNAACDLTEQGITDLLETGEIPPLRAEGTYIRRWDTVEEAVTSTPAIYVDTFLRQSPRVPLGESFQFGTRHVSGYAGNMQLLVEDIAGLLVSGHMIAVLCATEPEQKTVIETLMEHGITAAAADEDGEEFFMQRTTGAYPVAVLVGDFRAGYEMDSPLFSLLSYSAEATRVKRPQRKLKHAAAKNAGEAILSYADLEVGDLVVHASYGVGMYTGMETLSVAGSTRDYIKIQYAGSDRLFLPVDQLDLVSKYIGATATDPTSVKLSKMGGGEWVKAKSKATAATREMAKELIQLYARRKRTRGIPFEPDDDLCRQFADAFPYEETNCQTRAVDDIRRDMEAPCPMERLLCGDVGYGKTEVAIRAAFKAVSSGYQVAVLVPTTILAYQHYQTFLSRFRGFPCTVDMISRFRSPKEQAATVRALRRGDVDVIIGTHRLISSDIEFKKLGLVIVDEEQRFGVAQKEKLKQMAPDADVLTLTATPIPRTLNMAMSGITDMSILDEAPGQRVPVQTYVMEHDEAIITEAMRRELRRGGQVFYLNNNIEAVYQIAARIQRELPEARVAAAHGRMDRDELEDVWAELVRGEIDILVATTIIETGIDVPNANTLIIENADRYGLSQLHQIRGRVGRSSRRAYAYFTYRPQKNLSDVAQRRLSAIKEYAAFGAGFKIALRDLEIRGAGNLLGAEQHGHLDAVGYDLYVRLLNEAVLEEKGEKIAPPPECTVDFRADCYLPKNYIVSEGQRMELYKRIARIETYEDYEDAVDELCDRFGEPPAAALNLCRASLCRALGMKCGLKKVEETSGEVRLVPLAMNPAELMALSAAAPEYNLHVMLSGVPYAAFRLRASKNATDVTVDLLRKFAAVRADAAAK